MSWLIIIILSYLFFSLASSGDKIILAGPPKPKSYTFYVGLLNILAVLIIPFIDFTLPTPTALAWIILEGIVYIVGLYAMFVAIEKFDVSKVMPTIGATQPIFIFILTWMFWGPQQMSQLDIIAFIVLLLGTIIISIEKNPKLTRDLHYFDLPYGS